MADAGGSGPAVAATLGPRSPVALVTVACTNCGGGPVDRFCAACGQRHLTPRDFTARMFLHEMLGEMVSLDGRFWHTLWTLVRHPGKLAREYFDGRGTRYMRPLNLFLLLNLVFFLIQPHTGLLQWHLRGYLAGNPAAAERVEQSRRARAANAERAREARGGQAAPPSLEPMEVFESEFESTIQNLKKSMLLVAIPVFAMVIGATYGWRRFRLAEHLIFSTHFYAYQVFALAVLVHLIFTGVIWMLRLANAPRAAYRALNGELPLMIVLLALFVPYLYLGLRRMYGDGRLAAAARALGLFAAYQALVIAFAVAMFRVTLWAM